jgi:hypothetical protein
MPLSGPFSPQDITGPKADRRPPAAFHLQVDFALKFAFVVVDKPAALHCVSSMSSNSFCPTQPRLPLFPGTRNQNPAITYAGATLEAWQAFPSLFSRRGRQSSLFCPSPSALLVSLVPPYPAVFTAWSAAPRLLLASCTADWGR